MIVVCSSCGLPPPPPPGVMYAGMRCTCWATGPTPQPVEQSPLAGAIQIVVDRYSPPKPFGIACTVPLGGY